MKKLSTHNIFMITSLIAVTISSILILIAISQTLLGNQTVLEAAQVVYDQSDTLAIAQVRNTAAIQFLFLSITEISLLATGILGLRFANQKTTKTSPCLIFAALSLAAWLGEIFAWNKLDALLQSYDIYSANSAEALIAGVVILTSILAAYTIAALKNRKALKIA